MTTERRVLLGAIPHGLVAVLRPEAERLAELHRALSDSTTWGELRRALSGANRQALERHLLSPFETHTDLNDVEFTWPGDKAPFDADEIPGFIGGDWPPWPPRQALGWVPEEVQALGRVEQTIHNGPYLIFEPEDADRVATAFREAGYEVERGDELVDAACGIYTSGAHARGTHEGESHERSAPADPQGRAYLFDMEEGRPLAMDEEGEASLGLDRLEALLKHLAQGEHYGLLRRFAVWCAEPAAANGTTSLLEAARADADAWQGAAGKGRPDTGALEAARSKVAGAAVAASVVGLRHGAANAAAFLTAYNAARPDPLEAAREAARFHRLYTEFSDDGPPPGAVTQRQLDWLLDHLP